MILSFSAECSRHFLGCTLYLSKSQMSKGGKARGAKLTIINLTKGEPGGCYGKSWTHHN